MCFKMFNSEYDILNTGLEKLLKTLLDQEFNSHLFYHMQNAVNLDRSRILSTGENLYVIFSMYRSIFPL